MKDLAVIFDLDGVICDSSGRGYDADDDIIMGDKVNIDIVDFITVMCLYGYKIIIVTGREKKYERITREWLRVNEIYYDELYCVGYDNVVENKRRCLEDIMRIYDIKYAFDDNIEICKMYKGYNIQSFLVM